jgi:hypothetical protein
MTARERRFLGGALVLVVAATPPAILAGRGHPRRGCVTQPGFMGAQTTCLNRRTPEEVKPHAS